MQRDHVETILAQWRRERPDLDPSPMGIFGRISRISRQAENTLKANFKRHNLNGGTFDLLASLRRSGEPFTLTPTQLQAEMMLSSGATTHRIDLLEKDALIERLPDPTDRRGTLVRLTEKGLRLIDEAVETHIEVERQMLAGLSAEQQASLASLLSQMAQSLNK